MQKKQLDVNMQMAKKDLFVVKIKIPVFKNNFIYYPMH
jgi:hypothetical protein